MRITAQRDQYAWTMAAERDAALREAAFLLEAAPPVSTDRDAMPELIPPMQGPKPPPPKKERAKPKPRQLDMFPEIKKEKQGPKEKTKTEKLPPLPLQHQWTLMNNVDMMSMDNMVDSLLTKYDAADEDTRNWGQQWYGTAQEYIHNLAQKTGKDPHQVAAVMAAFSPRTAWDPNMGLATHFMLNYNPDDPDSMTGDNMPGLAENLERAKRIYNAQSHDEILEALQNGNEAPKITSFYKNMMGDPNAVTIDTWMARAILGKDHDLADGDASQKALGWTGAYDKMADAVRKAAEIRGIDPHVMQAIIWSHVNNTANYEDWTPKTRLRRERQKQRQWEKAAPTKAIPDYTHGPGWDLVDPETGQPFLPAPDITHSRNYVGPNDASPNWGPGAPLTLPNGHVISSSVDDWAQPWPGR